MKKFTLTPKEKEIAKKIITELIVSARFFEQFPAGDKPGSKKWKEGFTMGSKQMVVSVANLLKDKEFTNLVRDLLEIEIDEEKLFGKQRYKRLKKIKANLN